MPAKTLEQMALGIQNGMQIQSFDPAACRLVTVIFGF